ncbi:MAG: cytidylate kinase family protein [Lachnospiraceae bacterium]|nr:cytidylate kinase family protein [Lachnospiraceae bacterium]
MTVLTKQSIGRSADYVLRYYTNVVRIFIYAPESYREKKVMEMYGDSPEAAKKSIARSDAARSAYYKNVSGQEWGNPHGYELCIDASVGEEAAADMICSYIRRMGRS